jgi:hypothetical protein
MPINSQGWLTGSMWSVGDGTQVCTNSGNPFGFGTAYNNGCVGNTASGVAYVPEGQNLWYTQQSYPGSSHTCTIEVLYGNYR